MIVRTVALLTLVLSFQSAFAVTCSPIEGSIWGSAATFKVEGDSISQGDGPAMPAAVMTVNGVKVFRFLGGGTAVFTGATLELSGGMANGLYVCN
jgi:hypothetical protein